MGWLASILTFVSVYLLGKQNILGWPIGMAGSLMWIIARWGDWPVVVLNVLFLVMNTIGWRLWRQHAVTN